MRLKSEIWVKALLRQNEVAGRFGAVLQSGANEAGAVYVVVNHLDGTCTLLSPAPGSAYDDAGERRFRRDTPQPVAWDVVSEKIKRAKKFDADIWVVEVEDRSGLAGLAPVQD
jgi:hypothetical protein